MEDPGGAAGLLPRSVRGGLLLRGAGAPATVPRSAASMAAWLRPPGVPVAADSPYDLVVDTKRKKARKKMPTQPPPFGGYLIASPPAGGLHPSLSSVEE